MKVIAAGPIGPWLAAGEPSTASAFDDRMLHVQQLSSAKRAMKRTISTLLLTAAAVGLALGLVDTSGPGAWELAAPVSAPQAELQGRGSNRAPTARIDAEQPWQGL